MLQNKFVLFNNHPNYTFFQIPHQPLCESCGVNISFQLFKCLNCWFCTLTYDEVIISAYWCAFFCSAFFIKTELETLRPSELPRPSLNLFYSALLLAGLSLHSPFQSSSLAFVIIGHGSPGDEAATHATLQPSSFHGCQSPTRAACMLITPENTAN